jgi:hypothetical protein
LLVFTVVPGLSVEMGSLKLFAQDDHEP